MAGCGYAVLLLGVISTTNWARATVARAVPASARGDGQG
jgi:hypothetical protein